jgi:stage II sporulation protein R
MDGVFMYQFLKRLGICAAIALFCWTLGVLSDRQELNKSLIRFHVVANSDSASDQDIKLRVRDAVLSSIQEDLKKIGDIDAAKAYIRENIPKIQSVANDTLERLGVDQQALVSFCRETFDIRHYDTFSLPAGVYDSLRIVIGSGEGHNWWCVTFPSLCLPATAESFDAVAADAGLSQSLTRTISGEGELQIRFLLLDKLGQLHSRMFPGK